MIVIADPAAVHGFWFRDPPPLPHDGTRCERWCPSSRCRVPSTTRTLPGIWPRASWWPLDMRRLARPPASSRCCRARSELPQTRGPCARLAASCLYPFYSACARKDYGSPVRWRCDSLILFLLMGTTTENKARSILTAADECFLVVTLL